MNKKLFLITVFFLACFCNYAQVGIGTTNPKALLDLTVSDPTVSKNTDGILIPRIDEFPTGEGNTPTADQDGMLIFITGNGTGAESPAKGFYYWFYNSVDPASSGWISLTSIKNINDLEDAKSDNDGSNNGSSLFLGLGAGANDNESDNKNIGIGFNSLSENVGGTNNIALGYEALKNNASGNQNVAIGSKALFDNDGGEFNIAIGNSSGENITTGNYNLFLGEETGLGVTTGNKNVFLGAFAGASTPENITGSVFIGNLAGESEGNSNKLHIANSASKSLIYGDFSDEELVLNGKVAINTGTTSPKALLDITVNDPANSSNTDGILIPRINDFPSTNPTAEQDGMLVFITGNGTASKGFYYWFHDSITPASSQWIALTSIKNINDLEDGKSDSSGSSLFLGLGAGANDDETDNKNIGIGFNSLNGINTGIDNTAIGYEALKKNTSGFYNIALGNQALLNNIGSNNTAIGYEALKGIDGSSSSLSNTAIGFNAGKGITTGNFNLFLGEGTGSKISNGSSNVILGTFSGSNTSVDISGSVFLGYNAGQNETDSNKLHIANSSTNSLIYGDFDSEELALNGKVGINTGTDTPNAQLEVTGGNVRFSDYGSGTYKTEQETHYLGVENDGDIVEIPADVAGLQYYAWNNDNIPSTPNIYDLRAGELSDYSLGGGGITNSDLNSTEKDRIVSASAVGTTRFVILFTGTLRVKNTGTFTFGARSDDGSKILIDNILVVNNWRNVTSATDNPGTEVTGSITLAKGEHKIEFWYYKRDVGDTMEFKWRRNPDGYIEGTPINANQFFVK